MNYEANYTTTMLVHHTVGFWLLGYALFLTITGYLQVLIRWAIQNGTSVIPKATGESHIRGNLEALDFELTKEEMEVSTLSLSSATSDPAVMFMQCCCNHGLKEAMRVSVVMMCLSSNSCVRVLAVCIVYQVLSVCPVRVCMQTGV